MTSTPTIPQKQNLQEQVRPLDPNVLQRTASDPESNIWVNASAGTGKTKVLTDRVLRLLLPRNNGAPATAPHKILGITFTKAGANEMLLRINSTLRSWAILAPESETLQTSLTKLLGQPPSQDQISAAQTLFATVMNTPGGLKIMTIHSFCQSILGRFPLEAGITPGITAMDETQSLQTIIQAKNSVLKRAYEEQSSELARSLHTIASNLSDAQFLSLIKSIIAEQNQLQTLIKDHFGIDGLYQALCTFTGINAGCDAEELIAEAVSDSTLDKSGLFRAQEAMLSSNGKTDQSVGSKMEAFLTAPEQNRPALFDSWCSVFLKADGELRATLITQKAAKNQPDLPEIMEREALRLQAVQDTIKTTLCVTLTKDLLRLGLEILAEYSQLKAQKNRLDYDDMILKTLKLLQTNASWVLYKLDQGIDHILVDEAQDTNPEQWDIIKALCDEFYAHINESQNNRSVFVVGDQKQSIYSFQRASPKAFHDTRTWLEQKITAAHQPWQEVDLNISFRSAPAILTAVDAVFAQDHMRAGLDQRTITHQSFRRGQAGLVELWPVCETDEQEQQDIWTPLTTPIDHQTGADKLAAIIADKIESWLKNGEILASHNRPIRAGDIMILMRSRSALVHKLERALKDRNIPTSGTDRLVLKNHIAIQDLISAAHFTLLPEDDLNLACLLKSPLIGMDEDTLLALSAGRDGTLWHALQNSPHKAITAYLNQIAYWARTLRPYDLFDRILNAPCPINPLSGLSAMKNRLGEDVSDPLEEFLTTALQYEQNAPPNLQLFCSWLEKESRVIKRETEDHINHVRIMTIHGAKGLQAPIVILPDTMQSHTSGGYNAADKLLWPDKTGAPVPLWAPLSAMHYRAYKTAEKQIDLQETQEYNRLLYVAMTRAEDRLYIGGHTGKTKPGDKSWYFSIQSALQQHEGHTVHEDGTLSISNPQTAKADRQSAKDEQKLAEIKTPNWLYTPINPVKPEAKPLNPSQMEHNTPITPIEKAIIAAESPYDPLLRGNLTHKLLEILPNLPKNNQNTAATTYLERFGQSLPHAIRNQIVTETRGILDNPAYAPFFTDQALVEVPISGTLPSGQRVNGQIDRLLVNDQAVWLIDYKTDRNPPTHVTDIPSAYQKQMQAYATLLKQIHPGKHINAGLLWTDGPILMPVIVD